MTLALKIKLISLLAIVVALVGFSLAPATQVIGADSEYEACLALQQLDPDIECTDGVGVTNGGDGSTIINVAKTAINILSLIVGIASVIVIIIAGLRFITSGGDSQQVSSARSSIIYAIVGLIVVILAQSIVAFVLNRL